LQEYRSAPLHIVDLCTGTGCIALSLAQFFSKSSVIGVDISEQAVACARKNAHFNKISNSTFIVSSLFTKLNGQFFDIIVANPPYIDETYFNDLPESVRLWEDPQALIAAQEGRAILKNIIDSAPFYFNTSDSFKPLLVLEIDSSQADWIQHYMQSKGFSDITLAYDSAHLPRVVSGRYVHEKKQ
jgi:release factor glutamine methyltransferase